MKAILREGENIYHSQMHNVPKFYETHQYQDLQEMSQRDCTPIHDAKKHAIFLLQMPKTMQFRYFKCKDAPNLKKFPLRRTIQKKEMFFH
jgi:hypothetical protein